jgi:hypothetical protein
MVGMVSAMPEPTETAGENTSALYSVFCGILSIPSAFLFGFGAMFGVAGIALGWLGLRRADTGEGRRGMAIAGLVLSGLGVLLAILIVASA